MKNMYYEVTFKRKRMMEFVNTGFLTIWFDKGEIRLIEGVLTKDYVYATVKDEKICFDYYVFDFTKLCKAFSFDISTNALKLPLSNSFNMDFPGLLEIDFQGIIVNQKQQIECERKIQEARNHIFNEEGA